MDQTELLHQLSAVFREHGYEGATLTKLAASTGLGKASLYHHFPGGKAEIAATLLRQAVGNLEQLAFSKLGRRGPARKRLVDFVDGFAVYTEHGTHPCMIAAFSHGAAWEAHGSGIAAQFRDWRGRLAGVFVEAGYKPKRARREAAALLGQLYGELLMARLISEPEQFRGRLKRIKKALSGDR